MITNGMIPLLLWAANFCCIPARSSFSVCFLASTACAVISSSDEGPIRARNFKCLRYHGFLNMGEGRAENVSEFHSQINPMSPIMTVNHNDNFIMILVSWSLFIKFLIKCVNVSHPQPYKYCNKLPVHNYCTKLIQRWQNFFFHMIKQYSRMMHLFLAAKDFKLTF